MNLISIKNLSYSYKRNIPVLKDINLSFNEGQIVGIIGKKHSGKSTLLRVILGVNKNYEGELLINGNLPTYTSKALISYCDEFGYMDDYTIKDIKRVFKTLFDDFEVDVFDNLWKQLNKKEKTKLSALSSEYLDLLDILLALSRNTKIYLLDNVFKDLSLEHIELVKQVLYKRSQNSLILISSDDMKNISDIIERLVILENGSVILDELCEILKNVNQQTIEEIVQKYL